MAIWAMTPFFWAAAGPSLGLLGAAKAETPSIAESTESADSSKLNQILEQTIANSLAERPALNTTISTTPDTVTTTEITTPLIKHCPPAKLLQTGRATWYGPGFHNKLTANGERFNMNALTAAHRTLPLGMQVRVRNPATGQTVHVRINDRGPYKNGAILDLSRAAARTIGLDRQGLMAVELLSLDEDGDRDGTLDAC
jgi:rare lipoprotein A (peptidoglycan hydrolase)